jgi:hypothetical protein
MLRALSVPGAKSRSLLQSAEIVFEEGENGSGVWASPKVTDDTICELRVPIFVTFGGDRLLCSKSYL